MEIRRFHSAVPTIIVVNECHILEVLPYACSEDHSIKHRSHPETTVVLYRLSVTWELFNVLDL